MDGICNTLLYTAGWVRLSPDRNHLCAYPLSINKLPLRNVLLVICMFTMYFGRRLILPSYVDRDLGLFNTLWAVLLPAACP